jgi:hypothetical protein
MMQSTSDVRTPLRTYLTALAILAAFVLGWILKPCPRADGALVMARDGVAVAKSYRDSTHSETVTAAAKPKPIVIVRDVPGATRYIHQTDTIYRTSAFVDSATVIGGADTVDVAYRFPERRFDVAFRLAPDSVITHTIRDVVHQLDSIPFPVEDQDDIVIGVGMFGGVDLSRLSDAMAPPPRAVYGLGLTISYKLWGL